MNTRIKWVLQHIVLPAAIIWGGLYLGVGRSESDNPALEIGEGVEVEEPFLFEDHLIWTNIHIACGESGSVEFSWSEQSLDVIYHDCTMTESAEGFVRFLKHHIHSNYTITKKEATQ